MVPLSPRQKLKRIWNWIRGKRIVLTDPERGRVMIRTGHNSACRATGGQWYLQRYVVSHGPPPLPRCVRGRLAVPAAELRVERVDGDDLDRARRWYRKRHGDLPAGHDLVLICVHDPGRREAAKRIMRYRPNETFEVEYPLLSSRYDGPSYASWFGTWYGPGALAADDVMDFEIFWDVRPGTRPLPRLGASWR